MIAVAPWHRKRWAVSDEERGPYGVEERDGRWVVADETGRVFRPEGVRPKSSDSRADFAAR